jgi:hypothetical protein
MPFDAARYLVSYVPDARSPANDSIAVGRAGASGSLEHADLGRGPGAREGARDCRGGAGRSPRLAPGVGDIAGAGERIVCEQHPSATREATTHARGSLHYAGADRWVSMPNGAQTSRGWGRSSVEAGPTPPPWRFALPSNTPLTGKWITWAPTGGDSRVLPGRRC